MELKQIYLCLLLTSLTITTVKGCTTTVSPSKEECSKASTEEITCCFVEIEESNVKTPMCAEVPGEYLFALDFMPKITYGSHTNAKAKFFCDQSKFTCGGDDPKELFQCRKHSSTSKSCCMMSHPEGLTECALASSKFGNETTTKELFGVKIECGSTMSKVNILIEGAIIGIIILMSII